MTLGTLWRHRRAPATSRPWRLYHVEYGEVRLQCGERYRILSLSVFQAEYVSADHEPSRAEVSTEEGR